tara:strand:- start:277 stop:702 length:426 start_codon:yes stop_codon:yes gene_type:complete
MKFSESTYFNPLRHHLLEMPFGTFYFCEKFFVSELNEGVHFDWCMIENVMDELIKYYGKDAKLGYIPNRINSYSVNPHYWDKADKIYNMIVASAIVSYSTITMMNATIEKHFFSKSIKRCTSLTEAVDWILNLKELRDCQI